MAERVCPQCGGVHVKRVTRDGFLENSVFASLGYYPWKCKTCGKRLRLKDRGEPGEIKRRRRQQADEAAQ